MHACVCMCVCRMRGYSRVCRGLIWGRVTAVNGVSWVIRWSDMLPAVPGNDVLQLPPRLFARGGNCNELSRHSKRNLPWPHYNTACFLFFFVVLFNCACLLYFTPQMWRMYCLFLPSFPHRSSSTTGAKLSGYILDFSRDNNQFFLGGVVSGF